MKVDMMAVWRRIKEIHYHDAFKHYFRFVSDPHEDVMAGNGKWAMQKLTDHLNGVN